ncbi:MAG: hypothetical protein AB7F66_10945 [Bacteriovoracia bacterium]
MARLKRKKNRPAYINPKQRDNNSSNIASSADDTEDTSLERRSRGLIDKLILLTVEQIHFSDVEALADRLGARTEVTRLPELGWTFRVLGPNEERVCFHMWGKDKPSSRKVMVNPSDFRDYAHMKSFLIGLIGRNEYESADNVRTDFAVDIPDNFDVLKKFVYATRKNFCRAYYNNGEHLNGLQIGRSPEVVSVYDKAKKEKIPGPLTRLEVQLTGKNNPIKFLTQLPDLIERQEWGYYKPFRKIGLEGLNFTSLSEVKLRSELIRCVQAQTLSNELGGHLARKKVNANGKFQRDFSKYVQAVPYPVDLDKVWFRDMCSFFGKPERAVAALSFWDDDPYVGYDGEQDSGSQSADNEVQQ